MPPTEHLQRVPQVALERLLHQALLLAEQQAGLGRALLGLGGLGFVMGLSASWLLFTGLVGAWIKDRMGVAHRLTKLETQQQIIVGESKATREQLQALNETLLKVLVEKETK